MSRLSVVCLLIIVSGSSSSPLPNPVSVNENEILQRAGKQEIEVEVNKESIKQLLTLTRISKSIRSEAHEILDRRTDIVSYRAEDLKPVASTAVGKPEEIQLWDSNLNLGQVSGIAVNKYDDPIIFHRGSVIWDSETFLPNNNQPAGPITLNTILTVDQITGQVKSEMGANLFYMPHGISVDPDNNIWATDVGLHQVMMFPRNSTTPSLVLGEKFVPGSDASHFCKPSSVVVSRSGNVYVADGYCNKRVVVYDTNGTYKSEIQGDWSILHSLALFEQEDTLCIADREGRKVDCIRAGIKNPQEFGSSVLEAKNIGRVYGIAGHGSTLLAVTGSDTGINPGGITLDLADGGRVINNWGTDFNNPHEVAISSDGKTFYVAEIGPNRVRKFEFYYRD